MATTTQMRSWWTTWRCTPSKYDRVVFPGTEKYKGLSVADASVPVWLAVAQIMASEPYFFEESAGGTYVCRPIGGTNSYSLHAYALALDLNPSKNPYSKPLRHNFPPTFITRMEGIRANGKQAIQWGGRWSKPDAMHWQINVAPKDCVNVTWDSGETNGGGAIDMGNWQKPGDKVEDRDDMVKVHQWQGNEILTTADIDYVVAANAEVDWRWKFAVTKVVNVMMKP